MNNGFFKEVYKKRYIIEVRDLTEQELESKLKNSDIYISAQNVINGHPKPGDKIALDPKQPNYLWLIPEDEFNNNYET